MAIQQGIKIKCQQKKKKRKKKEKAERKEWNPLHLCSFLLAAFTAFLAADEILTVILLATDKRPHKKVISNVAVDILPIVASGAAAVTPPYTVTAFSTCQLLFIQHMLPRLIYQNIIST